MEHPKQILEQHGFDPKKSLGQNFLFEPRILRQIADTAEVSAADEVLEVGPGLGALTYELVGRAKRVVAVELDNRFVPILRQSLARADNFELVHGDILEQDPAVWFAHSDNYKVVANVPYYITGAILRHLLEHPVKPEVMVLTVQKDVAERMTERPPKMSILANSVQFFGEVKIVTNLAAGAFWPRPKIASSVIRIDLRKRPDVTRSVTNEKRFFKLVRAGFAQKRKQLQNNLRGMGLGKDVVIAWTEAAGVDGRRRAETLEMGEWVRLYEAMP